MSRDFFGIEKGLRIFKENSQTSFIDYIFDSGAPAGTSGETSAAPIGSIYSDSSSGDVYLKKANTNSASDWSKVGDTNIDELSWRNEKVRFATDDTLSAGNVDISALSDNESMVIADINVGEYCLGNFDGSPALFLITAKPGGNNITIAAAAQPIANNDTFVVQQYLPDTPGSQEEHAIVHVPVAGSPGIKISDFNWALADGISLNGLSDANGPVLGTDTVQVAIEKLEGDAKDSHLALGIARGDVNFGSFTGTLIADNLSGKNIFQRIENLLEELKMVEVTGITSTTAVDSVPVATYKACKWYVQAFQEATPANVQAMEVFAVNDGALTDNSVYTKLKLGANFNLVITTDVSGGNMRLLAASSTAGVTVRARRIGVLDI